MIQSSVLMPTQAGVDDLLIFNMPDLLYGSRQWQPRSNALVFAHFPRSTAARLGVQAWP
jgi:hypothetical protein